MRGGVGGEVREQEVRRGRSGGRLPARAAFTTPRPPAPAARPFILYTYSLFKLTFSYSSMGANMSKSGGGEGGRVGVMGGDEGGGGVRYIMCGGSRRLGRHTPTEAAPAALPVHSLPPTTHTNHHGCVSRAVAAAAHPHPLQPEALSARLNQYTNKYKHASERSPSVLLPMLPMYSNSPTWLLIKKSAPHLTCSAAGAEGRETGCV